MNTFNNTIAKKLISASIRSAIFIDEKLALPYSGETDESGICRDLYTNFQERGCSLSFHKFISSDIIAKDINPAKRNAMVVKNEKRFLKQKRNALKNPGYSRHPVKTQASFKRLLKAV